MIASIPITTVSRNRNSDMPTHSVIYLKEKKLDEKITSIVNDFSNRTKDARDNTLIVTPLNRDRKAIN
ncbi:hypothetical protein [Arsenophonus nasoniae]|uniref:Uncharacterized protein n=1 Tax=Arsenophonus nasoniae TaxID=638 RepID=A0AA95JZZ1_9GAMM|nr:hypothetical protein [Arsenophonus nasoniae]WGL94874.1 hypothetical protein QE207_14460 [Arsenophonus nasoniae]